MQSYVGRDSNAHAARRLNAPVDRRISTARTNVIVCLVNISWSAEKRDDTCSKTVSVLLLPANNEAERANGVGDLFRCKFRKRMPAAFFNSARPECTRASRWSRRWKSRSMWRCTRDLADYFANKQRGFLRRVFSSTRLTRIPVLNILRIDRSASQRNKQGLYNEKNSDKMHQVSGLCKFSSINRTIETN